MTVTELHREAQTALGRQDIDTALEAWLYAMGRTPTEPAVYMGLGICSHLNRWNATAIACFRRVLDFDPNNQDAKLNIRKIEELINQGVQNIRSHPIFGQMSGVDLNSTFETAQRHHEMEVERAYIALCQGIFDPRV